MFKNRAFLITALATLVLAVSLWAWFFWLRPGPVDRGVACKWDADQVAAADDECNKQCAVTYFGGTKNEALIKGKRMHYCCSKGYSPHAVNDPLPPHLAIDVVCIKD